MSNRRNRQSPAGPIEVIRFDKPEETVEEEQKFQPLFFVGDDQYDLWVNPPATVGLRYLKEVRENGSESGAVWLLYQMIGEDGYDALMNLKDLKEKQIEQIVKICKQYSMGDGVGNG